MRNNKKITILMTLLLVIVFSNGCSNSSSDEASTNSSQTTENTQSVIKNNDEKLKTWKEHDLGEYKFALTNDKYAIIVKDIKQIQDCIQLNYTFINESGEDASALWNFQIVPYQNGINLNDNEEYLNHYYVCKNEQTSIRSGYSIDDCSELIPIGDGSEIEADLGAGMFNETHLFKIDPQTMEWTIEEK